MDAIILRELLSKMAGVDPLQLLADKQIAAMAGGPVLQIETVASETRGALQTKSLHTSSDKLLKALSDADLVFPILVLLAQSSQLCVYKANTGEAVLKGLGAMFDDVSYRHLFLLLSLTPFRSFEAFSSNLLRF
jgi:THO complex subunit 2